MGDTRQGGSVNCYTVELSPHGNGTHTESVGHILDERITITSVLPPLWCPALVLSVAPSRLASTPDAYLAPHHPEDRVLSAKALQEAFASLLASDSLDASSSRFVQDGHKPLALVLRSLPPHDQGCRDHSGSNPVFLSSDAMRWIAQKDFAHLLVDLPSVDREDDAGILPNHRIFWAVDLGQRQTSHPSPKTISEMIFVPPSLRDGLYLLHIEIPPFALDAAPSRISLWPTRVHERG